MKVLEVYADFLPKRGGVATHIFDLSKEMIEQGHEPVVLVWDPPKPSFEVIEGIKVHRFYSPYFFQILRYPLMFYLSFRILLTAKQYDVDVIHAHDYLPGLSSAFASRFLHKPVAVTFHLPIDKTSWISDKLLPVAPIELLLKKVFIRYVKFVICVSRFTFQDSLKYFPEQRLKIIYNWVKKNREIPEKVIDAVLTKYHLSGTRFALSVGRLEEGQKAFSLLINALKIVVDKGIDLDLVLVGNGPQKNEYISLSKKLNIQDRVHILTGLDDLELSCLYKSCCFFALSSTYEALPIVVLEAMNYGKPVVATKTGGLAEIVEDGYNGILVNINSKDIARGIVELLTNTEIINNAESRSKEIISKKFSTRNASETIELLTSISREFPYGQ
jgi:L-malate glycosyltransferase